MPELTISKAAKVAGVPVNILQSLCERGDVNAQKRHAGHWYMQSEDVPDFDTVAEIVDDMYRKALTRTSEAAAELAKEIEAIRFDVLEALQSRYQPVGDDLHALLASHGHDPRAATGLEGCYQALRLQAVWVGIYRSWAMELRRLVTVPPVP